MLRRIRKRYEAAKHVLPTIGPKPAAALREVFKEGYDRKKFREDVLAGIVVGIVALPLSMALAIASGVPPQHGLYTAIVAGIDCTEIANHDDSEWGISADVHPGVFVRSIYFQDPDGILLEFACWTKGFGPDDVGLEPAVAVDRTPT